MYKSICKNPKILPLTLFDHIFDCGVFEMYKQDDDTYK